MILWRYFYLVSRASKPLTFVCLAIFSNNSLFIPFVERKHWSNSWFLASRHRWDRLSYGVIKWFISRRTLGIDELDSHSLISSYAFSPSSGYCQDGTAPCAPIDEHVELKRLREGRRFSPIASHTLFRLLDCCNSADSVIVDACLMEFFHAARSISEKRLPIVLENVCGGFEAHR